MTRAAQGNAAAYAHPVQRTPGTKREPHRRAEIVRVLTAMHTNPERQRGDYAEVARHFGVSAGYVASILQAIRKPMPRPAPRPVYAVEVTDGAKLGPVSATYAAQATCPTSCVFRNAGCYAEHGPLAMVTTKRLNRAALGLEQLQFAETEAAAIDKLSGTRDMRLHVVGDCSIAAAAEIVAAASHRFMDRGGRRVWTYTHAWRDVPREAWGDVSVLASCETIADVEEAWSRGYAAAITVQDHISGKRHRLASIDVLPCPEQTRGVQCADCRLCTDDARLRDERVAIAFALHGDKAGLSKARRTLIEARR